MTVRPHRRLAILAVLFLLLGFSQSVHAQDQGDSGFNSTAAVGNPATDEFLGALQGTDDGVSLNGVAVQGGYAYFNVVTNSPGTLHVWVDEAGNNDFTDDTRQFFTYGGIGTQSAPIQVGSASGVTWFRFVFEKTTNTIVDANTDYSATVDGEIEDWQFNVVASGSNVIVNAETGGVTTEVDYDTGDLVVTSNGIILLRAPTGNLNSLTIDGDNTGDDDFRLDMTNGDVIPAAGITFNGAGNGGGGDELTITDGTNNASVVHDFTNANDGSVTVSDGVINYTGLEPITDNVPAVSREFNFTSNSDTIVMQEAGGAGDNVISIDSNNSEIVSFDVSATTSITINSLGNQDVITIGDLDSAFTGAAISVDGGDGNDDLTLDLASDGPLAHGSIDFQGGLGVNSLTLENNSYTTATVDLGAGSLDVGAANEITFAISQNIVLDLTLTNLQFDLTSGDDDVTLVDDGNPVNAKATFTDGFLDVLFNVPGTGITINARDGDDTVLAQYMDTGFTGSITVNGGDDNDELRVNFDVLSPIPTGGISFDGGAGGTNQDNLEIFGGILAATITHAGTAADAGSVTMAEGTITYSDVENATEDNRTAAARVFTGTAAADDITLDDDGGAPNNIASYDADTSPEVLFDLSSTTNITLNAGDGNDNFEIYQTDGNYAGAVLVNGENDDDHLEVHFGSGDPVPAGGFAYDGGSGGTDLDSLELTGGSNNASITHVALGADSGSITVGTVGVVTYGEVENGITDDLPATTRVFVGTNAGEEIELDDIGGTNDSQDFITFSLSQNVAYLSPSGDLYVNALDGDDTIIVNDLDNSFNDNLTVNGDGGDDTLQVDWESGSRSPLGGIGTFMFDGGAHTLGDDLELINGTVNYVTHNYVDANNGTVEVDAGANQLVYTDIEPIYDGLDASTRTFNFAAADDIIFLDADDFAGTYNNLIDTVSSTEGASNTSESTEFYSDASLTSVTINGGGGSDFFDIEPSADYTILSDGQAPTTLTPGDQFTLNVANLPADEKITLAESSNTAGTYSFSKQGGGASIYEDVSYTNMELVTLRFSDPNAFSGSTYEGDWTYPIHTESGISVEPYFNWDIEINQALDNSHPSKYTDLRLDVSLNSDLSSPVFTTNTKEDGATLLINSLPEEDHYITDYDRDGFLLDFFTQYFWRLEATMTGGQKFCQIQRFMTVDDLTPDLDYPSEDLTIYDLDIEFDWNVASPTADEVYWRMELDDTPAILFVGDDPLTPEFLLMGEDMNDDDTAAADGYAEESVFDAQDLPTPLVWGTTYSWRVATMWPVPPTGWVPQEIFDKNETDRLVGLSTPGQFKTVTKAVVPTLTYPVGGLTIYDNEPVLSWNVQGPFAALTFELVIQEQGGPLVCSSPIVGISGIQFDTANCATPLVGGTTYEWQVRATDGVSTSAFSDLETFSILGNGAASASIPSYPVDDLEIYTTAPTFHWYTESEATGLTFVAWYKERLGAPEATCAGVQAGGTSLGSVSVTQVDVSGLEPGATYDWCVVTTGVNGSFESDVAAFMVAGGAEDGLPIASWPVGNPTTYTLEQALHWYVEGASLGITGYTVEVCVNDSFGGAGCSTDSNLTETTYVVSGLNYGDEVVWRVKASYSTGPDSDWTLPASQGGFTVTGALNTLSAELTYPVNGLILHDSSANLSWYVNGATLPQGVVVYEVSWSYTESFSTIGNITTTELTMDTFYNATSLIPGHTYWWRVRVSIDGGVSFGSWSQVGSFEIHPGASAPMPRLGSPTRSITVATSSPMLSWILPAPSTSALTYDLHVGRSSDLSDATVIEGITQTHFRLTDLESGQYFWAVRSHSEDGTTSPLSSVGTFVANGLFATGVETEDDADSDAGTGVDVDDDRTDDVRPGDDDNVNRDQDTSDEQDASVEEPADQVLPDEWMLGQNYPNPFNPTTTIEFSMPVTAGVTVRIYNVLGQVVKTLVNGTLPAGTHRVSWDATDATGASVTSGLYIYRMETTSFQATKTLVLMK